MPCGPDRRVISLVSTEADFDCRLSFFDHPEKVLRVRLSLPPTAVSDRFHNPQAAFSAELSDKWLVVCHRGFGFVVIRDEGLGDLKRTRELPAVPGLRAFDRPGVSRNMLIKHFPCRLRTRPS